VEIDGSKPRFTFRGKSGVSHEVAITDRRLARIVQQCQDLPGQELFQYLDGKGRRQTISSDDVNAYPPGDHRRDITAKDFRTWAGTMLAGRALWHRRPAKNAAGGGAEHPPRHRRVADRLGRHSRGVPEYYVHPGLVSAYLMGLTVTLRRPRAAAPRDTHRPRCGPTRSPSSSSAGIRSDGIGRPNTAAANSAGTGRTATSSAAARPMRGFSGAAARWPTGASR